MLVSAQDQSADLLDLGRAANQRSPSRLSALRLSELLWPPACDRQAQATRRIMGRPARRARPGQSAHMRSPDREVGLALVRPQRRGTLGLGADRAATVHPEVRGDRSTVDDDERRVIPHAVVRVDDATGRIVGDDASTQVVGSERDVEDIAPRAAGEAAGQLRPSSRHPRCRPGSTPDRLPWPWRLVTVLEGAALADEGRQGELSDDRASPGR